MKTLRYIILVALAAMFTGCQTTPPAGPGRLVITRGEYHGWPGSLVLSNQTAGVVIVPAIGRVMQFGFLGEEGVFWENRALDGQPPDRNAKEWMNFGGDKTWPAPEADWSKHTGHSGWRPPPAFDGMAHTAQVMANGEVVLTSPVDPFFGIRVHRRIRLHSLQPVMTITTTYEKVSGDPVNVGIWVITQFKNTVGVFVPIPENSLFTNGYTLLSPEPPPSLKTHDGLLSLARDPAKAHKIGSDAGSLVWVGEEFACRIDSPRVPGAEYPDKGSSAEVYTGPDPLQYIELETLGPLHVMKPGDKIERANIYTLTRRTTPDAEAEARKLLSH